MRFELNRTVLIDGLSDFDFVNDPPHTAITRDGHFVLTSNTVEVEFPIFKSFGKGSIKKPMNCKMIDFSILLSVVKVITKVNVSLFIPHDNKPYIELTVALNSKR